MKELIAKKYVKALAEAFDLEMLEQVEELLEALAEALKDPKISVVLHAPEISKEKKAEILNAAVAKANMKQLENFIRLLVEHDRIDVIEDIATVLRKYIADIKKSYVGKVYSDTQIDSKVLDQLGSGLSKKFDSTIALQFVQSDFDGIKVDVEDLGVEISFSKSRISKQIVEHILKAI